MEQATLRLARWARDSGVGHRGSVVARTGLRAMHHREPPRFEDLESVSDSANTLMEAFLYGVLGLVAVASLFLRYRRAGGVERQQIKWVAYAAAVVVVGAILAYGVHSAPGQWWAWWVGQSLIALGLVGVPIAIGILKYRLYEIDTLINRTLVYGLLTILLA